MIYICAEHTVSCVLTGSFLEFGFFEGRGKYFKCIEEEILIVNSINKLHILFQLTIKGMNSFLNFLKI